MSNQDKLTAYQRSVITRDTALVRGDYEVANAVQVEAIRRYNAHEQLLEALQILADYPLEEFGMEKHRPDRPLFGANEWQLRVGHVLKAREVLASVKS